MEPPEQDEAEDPGHERWGEERRLASATHGLLSNGHHQGIDPFTGEILNTGVDADASWLEELLNIVIAVGSADPGKPSMWKAHLLARNFLDAHNIPRVDPDENALVMWRAYHHIGNPTLMNASMLASLKPGGFLAIIDFPPDSAESADPYGRDEGEQHGVTSGTVARELGQAGFEVVTVEKGEGSDRYMVVARRPTS